MGEILTGVLSSVLSSGLVLFFVRRFFDRRDRQEEKEREADTCRPSSEAEEVDLFMNEGEDWDMAPVRMEMMLNRKGFRVVTLASADAGTSDEEIAGMAVALREKLDAESG